MKLSENEKWQAIVDCNETFDGKFFYGVKTTGIFCRPSCKSKEPKRENVVFFNSMEEASANGFRPCKRCRPDLFEYKPMAELLEKAKHIYDANFNSNKKITEEIKRLHISQNHLIRLYKQQFGITPVEYVNSLRIKKAEQILSTSESNILDTSLICGFGSLSSFYDSFKKCTGITPGEYRKNNNK